MRGEEKVAHFVAAAVEGGVVGAGGLRRPEGEEEHAPRRAQGFLGAGGMPAVGESLRREDDEGAARLEYGVAAGFFAGAHEGAHPRAAGAGAGGTGEGFAPLGAVLGPGPGAAEGLQHRQLQQRRVAVGKPLAPREGEPARPREEPPVLPPQPGAARVFENVAREGGELAALFHDPVVPVVLEHGRHGGRPAGLGRGETGVGVRQGGPRAD